MKNTRREEKTKQTSIICHFPGSAAFSVSLLEDSLSSPAGPCAKSGHLFGSIADVVSHSPSLNDAKCIFFGYSPTSRRFSLLVWDFLAIRNWYDFSLLEHEVAFSPI